MLNYDNDIKDTMLHVARLMSIELRNAIANQDCEGLEDKMERYFDMIRAQVKRIREDVAEELTC